MCWGYTNVNLEPLCHNRRKSQSRRVVENGHWEGQGAVHETSWHLVCLFRVAHRLRLDFIYKAREGLGIVWLFVAVLGPWAPIGLHERSAISLLFWAANVTWPVQFTFSSALSHHDCSGRILTALYLQFNWSIYRILIGLYELPSFYRTTWGIEPLAVFKMQRGVNAYKWGTFRDQNYLHKKGNVSPGKQLVGILRAQPGIMDQNLTFVIL